MARTIILDFDGTFYQTPCPDIPKLEDAIDLSQLLLLKDKLKEAPNKAEVLSMLDEKFAKLDKSKIGANLYNQNAGDPGHKSQTLADKIIRDGTTFSELLRKKDKRTRVFCARALAQMIEPNGEGNHRVSGMLNLGLDISQKDIAHYYRKYATVKYKTAKPNIHIRHIIKEAKRRGDTLVVYTDNSKENIKANLKKVGYKQEDFAAIVDMFDCNGGMTKKMNKGRAAFAQIMQDKGIDLSRAEFYDDNAKICAFMNEHFGILSVCVKTEKLTDVATGVKIDALERTKTQYKVDILKNKIHGRDFPQSIRHVKRTAPRIMTNQGRVN